MYNYFTMSTLTKSRNNINTKTNAALLVEKLVELGCNTIFGYPGAAVLSVYEELSKSSLIKHILVRHEQAAMHAAEGYARTSGNVGVVLVTSGPGFTNTITGIANAYADSTPLVVLVGDVSSKNKYGKTFQDVDIISMTKTCSKNGYKLSVDDNIQEILAKAFIDANTGVKGPVVIAMPRNVLEKVRNNSSIDSIIPSLPKYDLESDINALKELIKESQKPLVLVGGGAVDASEEITNFVTKANIPVISTLMGVGVCPANNPMYLGMIGINGNYIANSALNHADLIISLGVSFSDRSTCKNSEFAKKAKIVNVNLNKISDDFELEIQSDVKNFIKNLLNQNLELQDNKDWFDYIEILKEENVVDEKKSDKLHSSYVLQTLSKLTKNFEPTIVTDVGQHQMLTAQYFNFTKPRKFITSGGLGTMGYGLPAAIGAYIAKPDSLVINITGDGSFQMNLQELATCREHNIPIKIIIMNNGYLGMVRQLQEKIYKNTYQVEMTNPDFTKIAEAYDLFAIRITKKEELVPKLKTALAYEGTAIVDIMIDSFEEV